MKGVVILFQFFNTQYRPHHHYYDPDPDLIAINFMQYDAKEMQINLYGKQAQRNENRKVGRVGHIRNVIVERSKYLSVRQF